MSTPVTIMWFRQDLRLADNPALRDAAKRGKVVPVYILDDVSPGKDKMGGASRWWRHHSLAALDKSLDGKLAFYEGNAATILPDLAKRHKATHVAWNRCYEPWRIANDKAVETALEKAEIEIIQGNASLLWEPTEILKKDGSHYRVFTPFYERCRSDAPHPRAPLAKPSKLDLVADGKGVALKSLKLLPSINWDAQFEPHWDIGEDGAKKALRRFIKTGLDAYRDGRNFPAKPNVSRLSPHLHHGEVSPHQIFHAVQDFHHANAEYFRREVIWREFSYHILFHHPDIMHKNVQEKFDRMKWRKSAKDLKAWQRGKTGFPIVDAGMRQLWQTGYMHNRLRLITASFVIKNLLIDWRDGESWFWDCLVDADMADNSFNWQWVAGSGIDAGPFFRIFNPVTQGQKFDLDAEYILRYVPELKKLPKKYVHAPWDAPDDVLAKAGVKLGDTYPEPIVAISESRERALAAFKKTGKAS